MSMRNLIGPLLARGIQLSLMLGLALSPLSLARSAEEPVVDLSAKFADADPLTRFAHRAAWVHVSCLQRHPQQAAAWERAVQQLLEPDRRSQSLPGLDPETTEPLSVDHCEYEMALWSTLDRNDAHVLAELLEEVALQRLDDAWMDNPRRLVLGIVFMPFGVPQVDSLHPQGPAQQAGLKPLDQLLSIDGVRVASISGFHVQLARAIPGKALKVIWKRHSSAGTQQHEAMMVPVTWAQLSQAAD